MGKQFLAPLFRLVDRIKKLDENKLVNAVFNDKELQEKIISLNQEQLYLQGVKADGTPTGQYEDVTIEGRYGHDGFLGKKEKKAPFSTEFRFITWSDSFKFYESMKIINEGNDIKISGETKKMEGNKKFSKNILGLTKESKRQLPPVVRPLLCKEIRRVIFKK